MTRTTRPATARASRSPCRCRVRRVCSWRDGAGANPADLSIAYDQFPAPNDNSYGANAVGWGPHGHWFKDLTNSDHAGFQIVNPSGKVVLSFNLDYITSTAVSAAPSGYASLGPFGGDGGIVNSSPALTNDPAKITWDTSLARNLNKTGYYAAGVQVKVSRRRQAVTLPRRRRERVRISSSTRRRR